MPVKVEEYDLIENQPSLLVMEMLNPAGAQIFCLDTHALQWYGLSGSAKLTPEIYRLVESHWVKICRDQGVPPALARHVVWDLRQGRTLSSYWSYVFHAADPKDKKRVKKCNLTREKSSSR